MRILITGGHGYIGARLALYLSNNGHEIKVGSRRANKYKTLNNIQELETDWDNKNAILKICNNIDVVIHCAGMNADDSMRNPKHALDFRRSVTEKLVNSSISNNVKKFLYISSAHVYSNPLQGVICEDTPTLNTHPYALSHLEGEKIVRNLNISREIPGIVLRVSNCFGAPVVKSTNCWMLLINEICKQAVCERKLFLRSSGADMRDFISISTFSKIILDLINEDFDSLKAPIINVGSGKSSTVLDMANLVKERCNIVLGYRPEIVIPNSKNCKRIKLDFKTLRLNEMGIEKDEKIVYEIDSLLKFCSENF